MNEILKPDNMVIYIEKLKELNSLLKEFKKLITDSETEIF